MERGHLTAPEKKTDRGDPAVRLATRRLLSILLVMILLIPVQAVNSAVQTTSGTTKLSDTLQYGNTAYSVDYSYPSVAQVGKNLTVTVFLHVDSLTGLAEFILSYQIHVQVVVGTEHRIEGAVIGTLSDPNLYPGSVWGPKNITMALTPENTGISTGNSATGSLSITLDDTIKYGGQLSTYITEPAIQGGAGTLTIQNFPVTSSNSSGQGSSQSYLPYALLAAGAVLMICAVVLPKGGSPSKNYG